MGKGQETRENWDSIEQGFLDLTTFNKALCKLLIIKGLQKRPL